METNYFKITVSPDSYFHNLSLYENIKKNYYYFNSCLYGNMFISNIPSESTYSIDMNREKRVYENVPAPNKNGFKIFNLNNKLKENLTLFIKVNAYVSNNKLKIKLSNELFNKLVIENKHNNHNVFLLCKTPNGKYFVHADTLKLNIQIDKIKKVDSNMFYNESESVNGYYIHT